MASRRTRKEREPAQGHEYHYSGEGLDGDQVLARGNKTLFEHRECKRHVFLFHRVKDGSFKGSGGQPYRYEGEYMVRAKYVIDSTGQDEMKRLAMRFILTPHDSIANPLWDEEYEWEPARVPVYATGGQALPTTMSGGGNATLKSLYSRGLEWKSPLLARDDSVDASLVDPPTYLQRHSDLGHLEGYRVPLSDVKQLHRMFAHLSFAPGPWNGQQAGPVQLSTLTAKPFEPLPDIPEIKEAKDQNVSNMLHWFSTEGVNIPTLTSKTRKYSLAARTNRRLRQEIRKQRAARRPRAATAGSADSEDDQMQVDEEVMINDDRLDVIEITDTPNGRKRSRRQTDLGDVAIPMDSSDESSKGDDLRNHDAVYRKKSPSAKRGRGRPRGSKNIPNPKRKREDAPKSPSATPKTLMVVHDEESSEADVAAVPPRPAASTSKPKKMRQTVESDGESSESSSNSSSSSILPPPVRAFLVPMALKKTGAAAPSSALKTGAPVPKSKSENGNPSAMLPPSQKQSIASKQADLRKMFGAAASRDTSHKSGE